MGDDVIEPRWEWGTNTYRVVIKGDPSTEIILQGEPEENGDIAHPGWRTCAAEPNGT